MSDLDEVKNWGSTIALKLRAQLHEAAKAESLRKYDFTDLKVALADFEAIRDKAVALGVTLNGVKLREQDR